MRSPILLLASLAALRTSTALPSRQLSNPALCVRPEGIYDVCDTEHSFVRCSGHDALLITDCKLDNTTYCQVTNDRGSCNGTSPPPFPPRSSDWTTVLSTSKRLL
ncbi:hypothetical protein EKO27_g1905 [Xylaria grammica]|uniref:Chitin-binding type-2 domain-containing protein n=1 Tax=Xylaria grammica TaxID=363999 RepID=A0A439DFL4_9PEZI|nr:hypothetical protein EKO27_g1905 [Xylaria grammica]